MLDYKVISLYNKSNQFSIDVYQRTKTEFKIRTQIGFNSFSDDYCHGMYELAKTIFCYIINGYEMTTNNLGFDFAYSVHSGDFSEFEPPFTDSSFTEQEPAIPRATLTRTGYENSLQNEQEPVVEDLLIRNGIESINIEKELPWKLAD